MQKTTKIIVACIVALAIIGAYMFPQVKRLNVAASPVGTQFGTQKVSAVIFSPTGASATTTYLYNADQNDRAITDMQYYCSGIGSSFTYLTGAGLAALTFQAATTSNTSAGLNGNTNFVLSTTVATSSPFLYVATTTPGLTGTVANRVWAAGSYLAIQSNATGTIACTISTSYLNR